MGGFICYLSLNLIVVVLEFEEEHSNLSDQVKIAKDSFLGPPNIVDTLQKLGEYPIVKLTSSSSSSSSSCNFLGVGGLVLIVYLLKYWWQVTNMSFLERSIYKSCLIGRGFTMR